MLKSGLSGRGQPVNPNVIASRDDQITLRRHAKIFRVQISPVHVRFLDRQVSQKLASGPRKDLDEIIVPIPHINAILLVQGDGPGFFLELEAVHKHALGIDDLEPQVIGLHLVSTPIHGLRYGVFWIEGAELIDHFGIQELPLLIE